MISRSTFVALACWVLVSIALPTAFALADPSEEPREYWSGRHDHHQSLDHEAVREAVERGEIKPLVEILAEVKKKLPGEMNGVNIEYKHGLWLYEFRVTDHDGRLFDVYVDAKTGEIRKTKEK